MTTNAPFRRVPCRFVLGEHCISCGPDAARWLDRLDARQVHVDHEVPAHDAVKIESKRSAPVPQTLGSPIEQLFWEAYERLQLPELAGLVAQHQIRLHDRHYTLDFALVDQRVAFELDGYTWHSGRAAWAKDRRRDLALALLGWRTYRFDGSLVRADADAVVRMAAEIVRQGTR